MKKILFFVAWLLMASPMAWSANVDASAARASAERFLLNHSSSRFMAAVPNVQLAHAEMNSKLATTPVYYVFNSSDGFVIVSGDDRTQEILAYGDGNIDMSALPENMKFWLGTYQDQIEYLQAHPGLVVEKPMLKATRTETIEPMLEAKWDQGYPYYNQCPMDGDRRGLTGWVAMWTSAPPVPTFRVTTW